MQIMQIVFFKALNYQEMFDTINLIPTPPLQKYLDI